MTVMQKRIDMLYQKVKDHTDDVNKKINLGNQRMDEQDESLKIINEKLDTILKLHDNFEGFFKVMGWIGKATVWVAKISALFGTVWFIAKDHIK